MDREGEPCPDCRNPEWLGGTGLKGGALPNTEWARRAIRWLDRGLWVMLAVNLGFVVLNLWLREMTLLVSLAGALICALGLLRGRKRRAISADGDRL